jgi:PTH1 family peptidyl-tRNA hydrolase
MLAGEMERAMMKLHAKPARPKPPKPPDPPDPARATDAS